MDKNILRVLNVKKVEKNEKELKTSIVRIRASS